MKAEKLYKGEHSAVYSYRMHLIEVTDPSGWKPTWSATDRLTGKVTTQSVSLKACIQNLDRKHESDLSGYYANGL